MAVLPRSGVLGLRFLLRCREGDQDDGRDDDGGGDEHPLRHDLVRGEPAEEDRHDRVDEGVGRGDRRRRVLHDEDVGREGD